MLDLPDATSASSSVLVGIRHAGLAEGVRDLLAQTFDPVVAVPDEAALLEGAARLRARLAVVDLEFGAGNALGMLRRLRASFPDMRILVLSMNDSPTVERSLLDAGADRLILKCSAATTLVDAAEALLGERREKEATPK
jgi:DNA-binding NarL/FixJ family response regulator